jgi:hypothetical protein
MPRKKSSAQIHVADGTGGMRRVDDLRFEAGEWPIQLIVSAEEAENWMAHVDAEAEERGWFPSSISQLEATENSGTLSVHTAIGPSPATVDIVWERLRGKELKVRARPSDDPPLSLDVAHDFINSVVERVRTRKTLRTHQRALLTYDGLPWRGDLWLDADHRLGPPSRYPDTLLGPQIVIADAMIEGIGQRGVIANFQKRLRELQIFLGFVLGIKLEISKFEEGWVPEVDAEGRLTDCKRRNIGYVELSPQEVFPKPGSTRPIERRDVTRPGLGPFGLTSDMNEQWVSADIEQLWNSFVRLPDSKREHLLRAGNAYLIAKSMWPDQRTAYAAFLVVACEALKPTGTGRRNKSITIYDVIASLLSKVEAKRIRELSVPPHEVRHGHLHRGELAAGELLPMLVHDYFMDQSFDEMLRELSPITRQCLIEWLRNGGSYKVVRCPPARQPKPLV